MKVGMIRQAKDEARSHQMSLVKGRDTKPELAVRRLIWSMGYRYRLHVRNLPGKPDIVLPRFRKAIFVHGCFWHRHARCSRTRVPKTNVEFWVAKFDANVGRDRSTRASLSRAGWSSLVIWECVSENPATVRRLLTRFLEAAA